MSIALVVVPKIPEGEREAVIRQLNCVVGDVVGINHVIAELETKHAIVEVPSPGAGRVTQILKGPGSMVTGGEVLMEIDLAGFSQVPPPLSTRELKIQKYCCVSMFCAVEESSEPMRVSFMSFRGEPCWCIGEELFFISYCPWCGGKLPDHPFDLHGQ